MLPAKVMIHIPLAAHFHTNKSRKAHPIQPSSQLAGQAKTKTKTKTKTFPLEVPIERRPEHSGIALPGILLLFFSSIHTRAYNQFRIRMDIFAGAPSPRFIRESKTNRTLNYA